MHSLDHRAALVLIDVQDGFDDPRWGVRNNTNAESNMAQLLESWRRLDWPIFHIQHLSSEPPSPLRPEQPGSAIKAIVAPREDEHVIQKNVNSAFIGTTLEYLLTIHGINVLVMAGLTTDHCVSTSARMAANLGFKVVVVSDATATFDRIGPSGDLYAAEQIHELALVSLHEEFATIVDTQSLLTTIHAEGVCV